MIRTLSFVIAISTALAATATGAPRRGRPTPAAVAAAQRAEAAKRAASERAARGLVERHFAALAAGDTAVLAAIWSPTATVKSIASDGTLQVVPIATAVPLWLGARNGFRGGVHSVHSSGDQLVVVCTVRWNGARYNDRLVVAPDEHGVLRIVSKATSPVDPEGRRGHVGYGG